jgi:hypothetical protein
MNKNPQEKLEALLKASKPKVAWDKSFQKNLYQRIKSPYSFSQLFFMKPTVFAGFALLLILTPFVAMQLSKEENSTDIAFEDFAVSLDPNAFGPLSFQISNGFGGGGEAQTINYSFNYTGGDLPSLSETMPVYAPIAMTAEETNTYLESKGLGDWRRSEETFGFGNITLESPSYVQALESCTEENCSLADPISDEEVLSEDALNIILDEFLKEHDLDLNLSEQRKWYYEEGKKVVTMNCNQIVNEALDPMLFFVSIDMSQKEVLSFWLHAPEYLSSEYATAQNNQAILDAASLGGSFPFDSMEGIETIEVSIGTPTLVYGSVTDFQNGKTYYMPQYIFPIIDGPESLLQTEVIVPVIESMLTLDQRA